MILSLTAVLGKGYGVSVVVEELTRSLRARDVGASIGYMRTDGTNTDTQAYQCRASVEDVEALARSLGADILVAHTSPFFEILPHLADKFVCVAWEHGDPTPQLFSTDAVERASIAEYKRRFVYPAVHGVVAISEFIRSEIQFEEAKVIPNGFDHAWNGAGALSAPPRRSTSKPVTLGGLVRIGSAEAAYKGYDIFRSVTQRLQQEVPTLNIVLAGRGPEEECQKLRAQGLTVRANLTDLERTLYYRDLDIFFSPSLWEGCNLPLLEAQANGAVGLAFDAGAHPEATPYVMSSVLELIQFVENCCENRSMLDARRQDSFSFVVGGYRWDDTIDDFLEFVYSF